MLSIALCLHSAFAVHTKQSDSSISLACCSCCCCVYVFECVSVFVCLRSIVVGCSVCLVSLLIYYGRIWVALSYYFLHFSACPMYVFAVVVVFVFDVVCICMLVYFWVCRCEYNWFPLTLRWMSIEKEATGFCSVVYFCGCWNKNLMLIRTKIRTTIRGGKGTILASLCMKKKLGSHVLVRFFFYLSWETVKIGFVFSHPVEFLALCVTMFC